MASSDKTEIMLNFGRNGRAAFDVDAGRLLSAPEAPLALDDPLTAARSALAGPVDFPPLTRAVVAGDRVALALTPETPSAAELIAAVWEQLAEREIRPEDVTIVEATSPHERQLQDPRVALPLEVRDAVNWVIHDPEEKTACTYLATTASGERIYLSRLLIEADVVVSIGYTTFDPILGYTGTSSVFYPWMSSSEASLRFRGQGHLELEPGDERPLRQLTDEIAWLLGTQFTVQSVPSAGFGTSHVVAGLCDSVLRRGMQLLQTDWELELEERPELLVLAVDGGPQGTTWADVGAALSTARKIVARGGRVLLLTELAELPGPGMQLLQGAENPDDAIRPLGKTMPADVVPATQIAAAVDWARVFLLSQLPGDLVEDLFMVPVDTPAEAARLLQGEESCLLLPSAEKWFVRVTG